MALRISKRFISASFKAKAGWFNLTSDERAEGKVTGRPKNRRSVNGQTPLAQIQGAGGFQQNYPEKGRTLKFVRFGGRCRYHI
jgi:hypothetical protein